MKKKYLLFLGLGLTTLSFGQVNFKPKSEKVKQLTVRPEKNFATEFKDSKVQNNTQVAKAGGDLVWGSDFSNPGDWTIDNDGQTDATFGWDIGATSDGWFFPTGITSVSGGNYAELGNGDPSAGTPTQALDVVYTLTNTTAIPLTTTNVTLNFLQYGARFNDAQEVYISVDNTNWVLVGDNSDIEALSASGGAEFADPTSEVIVLDNLIPAGSTELWVRFSWTTAFPAQATNPNVWIAYGWFIDDVALTETYADDIALNKVVWGPNSGFEIFPYFKTPIAQVQPIEFGGLIENKGFLDKTDIVFTANITAESYTGISALGTVLAYETDTVFVANTFMPDLSVATYTANGFEAQTLVDDNPINNASSASVAFEITDFTYARDKGVKDGTVDDGDNIFRICNQFDVYADATLQAVDFFVDATTPVGSIVNVTVRDINTENFDGLVFSDDYTLLSTDLNKFITLAFPDEYQTIANTSYLVCAESFGGLVVGNSGISDEQTSFVYNGSDQTWYYTTNTPMVRMNFNPLVAVSNLSDEVASLSIYPNPAKDNVSVDFNLNNDAKVSINVTDLAGKVIFTKDLGNLTTGQQKYTVDAAAFSNGIYVMNIVTNGEVSSHKLAINK